MPETDKEKKAKKATVRPARIGVDPNIKPKITKKTGYEESSASVKDRPFQMYENPDYLIQNKIGRTGYWNAFQDYLKDYKLPTGESYIGNEAANRDLANDYTNLAIADYNKSLLEKYKDKPEVAKKMAINLDDVAQVQEYYRQGDPNVLVDRIVGGETSQFRFPSSAFVDVDKAKEGEFIPVMFGGKQYVIPAESYNRGITSADFVKYDPSVHQNIDPNYVKTLNKIRGGQAGGAFVVPEAQPTNITPVAATVNTPNTTASSATMTQGVTAPQGAITAPRTTTAPSVSNKTTKPVAPRMTTSPTGEIIYEGMDDPKYDAIKKENARKRAMSIEANPTPTVLPTSEEKAPMDVPQNKAKGGKIMAPKMKKYAVGGEVVAYNFQGQPLDRYGKVIENEGMSTEDVGKSALDILTNAAGKIGSSKTTTTGNANASVNATSDATNSAQSGSTESGGAMDKLGGKSALIGAATDLGVAGAGLGAAYIDSKNKDARGRYKSKDAAMGSSALKGTALGTKLGANPALVAATGGMSILAGAGLGALGGGIYGAVRGKKDVESIKASEAKMKSELAKANTLTNQQRAIANREAGILEGNLATPLTEGEAMYNEKDELINPARYAKGGVIGAARMMYAKGGTIVGKGGPKDDAIFTKANKEGIEPGSFIVPAENNEKAKGIRAALFGDKNKISKFKKGGEMESNVAVSNGEHLFTPKERKKIVNYLGEEILEELAPNAEENSEEMYQGGLLGTMTDRANMREYVMGGMIKRADGSYSKRGLWDNIRDAAGSGKQPTAEMLKQEKKIKAEYYNGGIIPVNVASQKRTEQIQDSYKSGGYVVQASSDREGKTHKVTGPDGTVKYFGDSNLGQHPSDPKRKEAFYARHKENLDNNPYFRAYARETWAEGGTTGTMMDRTNMAEYKDGGLTKSKAKTMLHEGMANGKPITEQQRKYFGWVAGGSKQSKMDGGKIMAPKMMYNNGGIVEGAEIDGVKWNGKNWIDKNGNKYTAESGKKFTDKYNQSVEKAKSNEASRLGSEINVYSRKLNEAKASGNTAEANRLQSKINQLSGAKKEVEVTPKGGVTTTATTKSVATTSVKGGKKVPESVRFVPKMVDESEGEGVIVPGMPTQEYDESIIGPDPFSEEEKRKREKASLARITDSNTPPSPPAPRKGLADYVKNIDPGAAFSAYQIMQGSKLLKSGERPEDVSKIDPAWNAAVERAQRDATFGYTPEQAAMLDQKAINALGDARFSGRNLAGGSAGTAFQQERQAINQGWSNALQLKSADQQLRM
ncbi:MAG: hypothetical protein ACOVJ5_01645, partial [Gloeomargaritales cyanobacterium]